MVFPVLGWQKVFKEVPAKVARRKTARPVKGGGPTRRERKAANNLSKSQWKSWSEQWR